MSDAARGALRSERLNRIRRRRLLPWVMHVQRPPGGYLVAPFHVRICAALERFSAAVARKESPRLMILTPPRHGKTAITSQAFPVWYLARNPGHEFACASYGDDLADDNSRIARVIARSQEAFEVFPELEPKVQKRAQLGDYRRITTDKIDNWSVGSGGSYKAVGVGSALTGRGAHVLCIDDPHKDRQEADSLAERNKVWNWYTSTAHTRLAPGGGVVLIQTRWHEDDLGGRLLDLAERGGDPWEVLHLPAIAERDELVEEHEFEIAREAEQLCGPLPRDAQGRLCWRLEGEPLHLARYPLELLEKQRALSERDFEALYQGRPVPVGGNRIREEWFAERRYKGSLEERAELADEVWVSVDSSKKAGADSDLHALHLWCIRWARTAKGEPEARHLLDRVAGRMTYPEFERTLDAFILKWRHWLARKGGAYIEDTANGTTYLQVRGGSFEGVPLIPFSPTKDTPGSDKSKEARAVYLERPAEAGTIWIPDRSIAPWIDDVLMWWCGFPSAKHDDDVDAASQINMRWTLQSGRGRSALDALAEELGFGW